MICNLLDISREIGKMKRFIVIRVRLYKAIRMSRIIYLMYMVAFDYLYGSCMITLDASRLWSSTRLDSH